MHKEHFNALQPFVSHPIIVAIQGEEGEERAAQVQKVLTKLECCPDYTHLRLYFNQNQFLAIPFTAQITQGIDFYKAYDSQTKLYYHVTRINNDKLG